MSNFFTKAKRPERDYFEEVEMLDNYYGAHRYGVRFTSDDKIYEESRCQLIDSFEEDKELNAIIDAQRKITLPDLDA
jgi:hypothetical protein